MAQVGELVRSLPYPAIEDGNLSFPDGEYLVENTPQLDGASVVLSHAIKGAALLERLISEGKARYACVVSVPATGYRRLYLSDDARQRVEWDMGVVGEPPMLRPLVVAASKISCVPGPDDGVAEAWQRREIVIPIGARLARHPYLRPTASLQRLLHVVKDEALPAGCFEVKPCEENGFYFKVHAASNLFLFLQGAGDHKDHRSSVLTHVASRCLEILAQEYGKGEGGPKWEPFSNLRALENEFNKLELPVWDADDFAADRVATRWYPYRPPVPSNEE